MYHIRLIHWNELEAQERAARLQDFGYKVEYETLNNNIMRAMRDQPPSAVVIDLNRITSHGRDVVVGIRSYKTTRHVPIVFVGGQTHKMKQIKDLLPDAVYTSWNEIKSDLQTAIDHPPSNPIVPKSRMAGYAGTPLPKKLGIKPNSTVILVEAPEKFEEILEPLPEGVKFNRDINAGCDLTLWFVQSQQELKANITTMVAHAKGGGLWIVWPKKTSGPAEKRHCGG